MKSHDDSLNYYIVSELYQGGELFDRIVDQKNPLALRNASEDACDNEMVVCSVVVLFWSDCFVL